MTAGFAVTTGWDVPVGDQSHIHGAVAMADAAAARAELTPPERASCALIATELATNLSRHARDGRMVVTATDPGPCSWVQLATLDSGPGIPDVEAAMADGYSTANSLGGGLGACRRAAGAFDLYAGPGTGTVVIARVGAGSRLDQPLAARVGGILSARPGEQESGDGWCAWWGAAGLTVTIVDGLGHGPEAAEARNAGLRSVADDVSAEPAALLTGMNRRLSGGRGAVAAAVRLDHGKLAFCGVGNIAARLGSGRRPHGLVSSMGTLGLGQRIRPLGTMLPWGAGSAFIAHTDGVRPGWDLSRYPGATARDPAIMAALIWRDAVTRTDDSAVIVVVPPAMEAIHER
jgi:anti-sigma regulatory factor (Ser/Thr protein kinase)